MGRIKFDVLKCESVGLLLCDFEEHYHNIAITIHFRWENIRHEQRHLFAATEAAVKSLGLNRFEVSLHSTFGFKMFSNLAIMPHVTIYLLRLCEKLISFYTAY